MLREATVHLQLQPVLCGSALHGIGVQPVLDAVQYYLPSPLEVPPVEGESVGEEKDGRRKLDCASRRPRAVLRPRVQSAAGENGRHSLDPRLFRVAQAKQPRAESRQGPQGKRLAAVDHSRHEERRANRKRLSRRHRRRHRPATVDHRRHDVRPESPILLETIQFPETVISMAIEPESTRTEETGDTLEMLKRQDPTLQVRTKRPARRSSAAWANCTWK